MMNRFGNEFLILYSHFLFTDGPLSFSGQPVNMHKPLIKLCNHLLEKENLFLVGLEKSPNTYELI
jgi:hypothetical protein